MKIILNNKTPYPLFNEPIHIGVPCPKGKIFSNHSFHIYHHNKKIPVQTEILSVWPDESVKWMLCDFLIDIDPKKKYHLKLEPNTIQQAKKNLTCNISDDKILVDTGIAQFEINRSIFSPFQGISVHGTKIFPKKYSRTWVSKASDFKPLIAYIDSCEIESSGPVRCIITVSGHFGESDFLLFSSKIHFYAGTAKNRIDFTIHNSQAAKHPGGLWDLGDPSSILLKELVISFPLWENLQMERLFKITPEDPWQQCPKHSTITVYQESSGEKYWDSPNHRNREGLVPMKINGYQTLLNDRVINQGKQAQPVCWAGNTKRHGISLYLPNFWQEFPKSIKMGSNSIDISLYPGIFPDLHELQGGEQKTHTLYLDFDSDNTQTSWGTSLPSIAIDPETIKKSKVFQDITFGDYSTPDYEEYTIAALTGTSSFFAKRDAVDEYGWRNFGELYADHEAVFHKGDTPFVSHYNNQYDALASFYREFFLSGDHRWARLAGDLARHIYDIDINHTDNDREEYCHGLFWHTDHYLDAGLCTHRMASKEHLQHKDAAFCGGGPAAEHCYTTGLTCHYFFCGDPLYKETVLRLADWSYISLRGSQTLLGALLRGIRTCKELKNNRNNGNIFYRYPFTRGTGNTLNAQLDAFELTADCKYLDIASDLIYGTIHPSDNIERRDLLNAEICWSYSVFLVAVCKFLEIKYHASQVDEAYNYARDSLLHYSRWIAQHEKPYLDDPDKLEYPNETWAAQDLRKGVLLHYASKHVGGQERKKFLDKSTFFFNASFKELKKHSTRFFTRPLILILQNGRIADISLELSANNCKDQRDVEHSYNKTSYPFTLSWKNLGKRFFDDIRNCSRQTTISKELSWLKFRFFQ